MGHKSAQARRIESRIALKPLYRQRDIIGSPIGAIQSGNVAKEVYGWTRYLGW